jgi:hypothetical protein
VERPTAITVFGVLNIVIGLFGLCCSSLAGLGSFVIIDQQGPLIGVSLLVLSVLMLLLSFALAASGIGFFSCAGWARMLALITSILYVPVAAADVVLGLIVNSGGYQPGSDAEAIGYAAGSVIGVVCGGVLRLIYPCVLLVLLNKPNIKAAFR